jgi:hypothetical protein
LAELDPWRPSQPGSVASVENYGPVRNPACGALRGPA